MTDRLETLGLAALIASIALFTATALSGFSPLASPAEPLNPDVARTVAIAVRARADGRDAHADALLASIASTAVDSSGSTVGMSVSATHETPSSVLTVATHSLTGLALGLGFAGVTAMWLAARRRRRAFRLLSAELDQPNGSDDPGVLVGALFRIRAERSAAQSQLHNALSRLEHAAVPVPKSTVCPPPSPMPAMQSRDDIANAHPFHELGRIVEITPILPG